jgi:predicted transcriptional regulator of viral defense system
MAGSPRGISEGYRRSLDALHRQFPGPFSVAEAARALSLERARTGRRLANLAARGWLSRVRRDAYVTVPLGADQPGEWREDPWVVAARVFAPGYLAGWTACEHWGLTEQIFRDIQVVTSRRLRNRNPQIQGTRFHVKTVDRKRIFGTRTVWREHNQVEVSDPSRTVIDLLDDPGIGGGARQVAEILISYFESEHREDGRLDEYGKRLGNRTVWKRLGFLLEALAIDAPTLIEICRRSLSTGISLLDPAAAPEGKIVKRWNLRVNVIIRRELLDHSSRS